MSPFAVIRAQRDETRPDIPDSVGLFMQQLIRRCWSKDPSRRPSFQAILDDIFAPCFVILPEADSAAISQVVLAVLGWEASSAP
jgi:hypothetical protein